MIGIILTLVVLGLLYYCCTLLPLPEPFPTIIKIVFIILAILVLLQAIGLVSVYPYWGRPLVIR